MFNLNVYVVDRANMIGSYFLFHDILSSKPQIEAVAIMSIPIGQILGVKPTQLYLTCKVSKARMLLQLINISHSYSVSDKSAV